MARPPPPLQGGEYARPISEHEFQTELNLPIMGAGRCNSTSGVIIRPILKNWLQVGLSEIRVIEHVEELGTERDVLIFLQVEALEYGEVDVHEHRADDRVSSHISEKAWNGGFQTERIW